ncbi:membrane-bound lytic murein transglycosylase D [Balneicella halophila]|uniref:Membrane-bound lytic murein transglycosylase D n=1 Tax=Balneicella halophila TaxID=1537566 RepID=A0A7L4UN53_BALHA|nr:lytic transglycosylase domain-containing protein [Balneicella halophila]PVX50061.1 membrane-bound lytic murein transglycosylase D [Balneicella halophila]
MNYLKYGFYGFILSLILSSCSIFQKDITYKQSTSVSLADEMQLEIYQDTATVAFEKSFYEEIEADAKKKKEVDLDELYASFENVPEENLPVFSPEQTALQVNAMSGSVELKYTDEVQKYINRFVSKSGRKYMSKMLALSQLYFPIFEQILSEEGVPEELKYAAIVESALIPNIMSKAGAVGLWQFMYGTGKEYGLEINGNVDQRCDMIASTRASARYMRELYQTYNDWLLVLAAYNCGPGNVNKAIKRSGGDDFWSIYEHLPRETRRHIPKYIATYYAFFYHTDLMIAPMRDMVKYTDVRTVMVDKPMHLGQVAGVLGLKEKDVAELNRTYLKGYIPAKENKSYRLVLPTYESGLFASYQDSIYGYNRSEYFSNEGKLIAKKKDIYPSYGVNGTGTRISYKVRRGDYLGRIARRHGTTVRNIKKWNGLRSDRIRAGQRLVIYTNKTPKTYRASTKKVKAKGKNKKLPYLPEKYVYHTVKKNENCWSIAQKYEGVTQDSILELNKIINPSALRVGQKLRIKEI